MRIPLNHQARRVRGCDAGGWLGLPPIGLRHGRIGRLLGTRGSLTAALGKAGDTRVRILRQRLGTAHRDERSMIGNARAARLRMVREVALYVDGVPWVFAHTLANAPAQRLLRRAGRRPLATVLFTDPRVSAGGLHYRTMKPSHPLASKAQALLSAEGQVATQNPITQHLTTQHPSPHSLAARRAVFRRGAACLMVTEVFLPAALACQCKESL
jgi:chorismate lyase